MVIKATPVSLGQFVVPIQSYFASISPEALVTPTAVRLITTAGSLEYGYEITDSMDHTDILVSVLPRIPAPLGSEMDNVARVVPALHDVRYIPQHVFIQTLAQFCHDRGLRYELSWSMNHTLLTTRIFNTKAGVDYNLEWRIDTEGRDLQVCCPPVFAMRDQSFVAHLIKEQYEIVEPE